MDWIGLDWIGTCGMDASVNQPSCGWFCTQSVPVHSIAVPVGGWFCPFVRSLEIYRSIVGWELANGISNWNENGMSNLKLATNPPHPSPHPTLHYTTLHYTTLYYHTTQLKICHPTVSTRKTSLQRPWTRQQTTRHRGRRQRRSLRWRRRSPGASPRIHQIGQEGRLQAGDEWGGWVSLYLLWFEVPSEEREWALKCNGEWRRLDIVWRVWMEGGMDGWKKYVEMDFEQGTWW